MSTAVPRVHYVPALDGLRAVAVYLVVCFHASIASWSGGFVGVDLFFVLSGFLITWVLTAEVAAQGRFDLGGFYARRMRRLLPAALVAVVLIALVQVVVASQTQRAEHTGDARGALLYYANWHFIGASRDYFEPDVAASPYLHFWSLSIEEQFYIVFPLLVLVTVRRTVNWRRAMVVIVGVVAAASVVLQIWWAGRDSTYAYYATEARVYQLAAGVLLALLMVRGPGPARVHGRAGLAAAATAVGILGLLVTASGVFEVSASTRGLAATGAALVAVGGLYAAPDQALGRVLGLGGIAYLGRISYGTYLWHWPVILVLREVLDVRPVVLAVLAGVLATGLAAASYELVERPVRGSRRLGRRTWVLVSTGLVVSSVVALALVPVILRDDARPSLRADRAGAASPVTGTLSDVVPEDLDLLAAKGDFPEPPAMCTTRQPDACTLVDGDGPHVVVIGDSQANMFTTAFVALAEEQGWRLSVNTVVGCPWQEALRHTGQSEQQSEPCQSARGAFYRDVLPRMEPDVIALVGMSHESSRWESRLSSVDGPPDESLDARMLRTTEDTTRSLLGTGADIVIVKSILGTEGYDVEGFDPIECLSRASTLGDCVVTSPLATPPVDAMYDVLATELDEVATLDVNPMICPDAPLCSPVVDGRVVWKDRDHVTAGFLHHHRDELWTSLQTTGFFD